MCRPLATRCCRVLHCRRALHRCWTASGSRLATQAGDIGGSPPRPPIQLGRRRREGGEKRKEAICTHYLYGPTARVPGRPGHGGTAESCILQHSSGAHNGGCIWQCRGFAVHRIQSAKAPVRARDQHTAVSSQHPFLAGPPHTRAWVYFD